MDVHLIDGTYELFRCFFGAPSVKTEDGREVGAVRAFVRSMWRLRAEGATHVGVAFDTVIESFRNQLFAGYKTGAGIDANLLAQFPLAEQASRAIGLATWSMIDFEADDALATMAHRAAQDSRVERVLIASPDKDLCQCVQGTRVVAWDRKKQLAMDADGVRAKHGVSPASIPDYLALVGDTADGIPGVPRWGEKGAAAVLSHYNHIDFIPREAKNWPFALRGKEALAEQLTQHLEAAKLYRVLATLRVDVPLEESVDALAWGSLNEAALADFIAHTGDRNLPERLKL
jgi:5'-3' exonuclease